LALACSVNGPFFANIPELTRCLKEKELHAPVTEMSIKVFYEFFIFQVAAHLSYNLDSIGPMHH